MILGPPNDTDNYRLVSDLPMPVQHILLVIMMPKCLNVPGRDLQVEKKYT